MRTRQQLSGPELPDAACRGDGTIRSARQQLALFFGQPGERPREAAEREIKAKAICATCPHLDECRRWAIDNPDTIGDTQAPHDNRTSATYVGQIIGGTAFTDRYAIRSGRAVQRRKLEAVRPDRRPLPPIVHGTVAGFAAHVRRGETPCEACRTERNSERTRSRESPRRRAKLKLVAANCLTSPVQ